ncbi:(2Fe-2S)-binding protein [Cloacibacillus evryensis]|uniref:(2Fe-2S)-binding protein n=1 Tax=Cloacibacillus evryensis TaxID=508460 RepID=UPI0026DF6497|nr:(2Fe-2S)-binding protein [Cloacibacillus evryensis]
MAEANVICRCEEVEIDEIRKWIAEGYTEFNELKRLLRVGMGPCQGRGCRDIILKELSKATGTPINEISLGTIRPPVKPIKIALFAEED